LQIFDLVLYKRTPIRIATVNRDPNQGHFANTSGCAAGEAAAAAAAHVC
jgi:hypothetical protein